MPSVHSAAQQGLNAEAQRYAQGRLEYPEALSGWLRDVLGLCPQTVTVDLGAGTGKLTRLLTRTGARMIAVELVDAMHAQLTEALPQVQALTGNTQSTPLAGDLADALVCAQAFHWFATVEALEEMHRMLTAEGGLGLVWNVRGESLDWVAEITRIITPYGGDAPCFYKGDWRRPFERAPFEPLRLSTFAYGHVDPPEQVIVSCFLSVSFIAALPETEKNAVTTQLREPVASHPAPKGEEQIVLPYRTEAYLAETRWAYCPAA